MAVPPDPVATAPGSELADPLNWICDRCWLCYEELECLPNTKSEPGAVATGSTRLTAQELFIDAPKLNSTVNGDAT